MALNPYQSPTFHEDDIKTTDADRAAARRSSYLTLLIFAVPVVYNFICLANMRMATASSRELPAESFFRFVQLIGIANGFIASCFFALPVFEFATMISNRFLGRPQNLELWKAALYRSIRSLPKIAVPGAFLWLLWVFLFYKLGFEFMQVSVPIGIAAHLLAAAFYIPLFVSWFKIERSASVQ